MITLYNVDVVGIIWQGTRVAYSKTLATKPNNIHELKTHFGDFNIIEDYQVTEITHEHEVVGSKSISTKTEEVIQDFRYPDSADMIRSVCD